MDRETALRLARRVRASIWGNDHKVSVRHNGDGTYYVAMLTRRSGLDRYFNSVQEWETFCGE